MRKVKVGGVWAKSRSKEEKSEQDYLRFTEGMKYDGDLPRVITAERRWHSVSNG